MAATIPFGKLSILETVNLGLTDVARSLRELLLIAAAPTLLTALYQSAVSAATADGVPIWTTALLMLPEFLISAPFYMALLYQLSRIRHSPPTPPRDALFAGLALLRPYIKTSLILVSSLLAVSIIVLGVTLQAGPDGQVVIGLAGLVGILLIIGALLALSFYPHVILFEQRSGIAALKRSLLLFRANWLRILAVLVLPMMLIMLMQSLLFQLLGLGHVTAGETPPDPGFIGTLLIQLFSWAILGIFEGVRLVLFQDLLARPAS